MQLFIHSKGPNYADEFVGMVAVIAIYATGCEFTINFIAA
jgi:hypothetical protein